MATILIIDDDDAVRDFLVEAIELAGYEVVSANGGIAGIAKFAQSRPDMVLTDIIMPDRGGLEVIAEIRSTDPGARIVAISGGSLEADAAALQLGAAAVLQKPFKLAQLIEVVEDCLRTHPDAAHHEPPGAPKQRR